MTKVTRLMTLALVLVPALAVSALAADPETKSLNLSKKWAGSVGDLELKKEAPAFITDAKALEKLWKTWKVPGKVPKVDFAKELVVTGTTRGSVLNLMPKLDEKGNLEVLGMASTDLLLSGFNYVIATISREGIKTVGGKKL